MMHGTDVKLADREAGDVVVRAYQVEDFTGVVDLWNHRMVRDGMSEDGFVKKVLCDVNFDPEGVMVARCSGGGGDVVGFMLGVVRREPLEGIGLQEEQGWITMFFVDEAYERKGVGGTMLEKVMGFMKVRGRKKVTVSTYVPNYFVPGVDTESCGSGVAFLEKYGFEVSSKVYGMGSELQDMAMPVATAKKIAGLKEKGIELVPFEKKYVYGLLAFLRREFAGDWANVIVEKIKAGTEDEIVLAVRDREVLGYCQHEGGHFGPFGVSEKLRGEGLGRMLYWWVVEAMKRKGEHFIWLAWTGGDAKRFYEEKGGLRVLREHAIMVKEI